MQRPSASACASPTPTRTAPPRASCRAAGARQLPEARHGQNAYAARQMPLRLSRPGCRAAPRSTSVAAASAAATANAAAAAADARPRSGRLPRPLDRRCVTSIGAIATGHASAAPTSLLPPSQRARAHPAGTRGAGEAEAVGGGAGAARRRAVVVEATGGGGSGGRGGPGAEEEAGMPKWVSKAWSSFSELTAQQKAWTVAAGVALLVVLPRAVTLILVAVERLIVGSLLATEALVSSLLLRSVALLGVVGVVGLLLWGLYVFAVPASKRKG